MNIQQLKTLMEINALRSLPSTINTQKTNSSSLFSSLLEEFILTQTMAEPSSTHINEVTPKKQLGNAQPIHFIKNVQAPHDLEAIILEAAEKYQLPPALLTRVIKQESNFNPFAVSPAGAKGYMQLMPETAKSLGVKNIFDPYENIMAGAKYLRNMLDRYGSLELALAAYNAGPGNVDKYGGIPPFKETQNYVRAILQDIKI